MKPHLFMLIGIGILHFKMFAQQFGGEHALTTSGMYAYFVIGGDIDNDGDVDLISAFYDNGIYWYENLDGLGTFGGQQTISTSLLNPVSIYSADIDGDGDLDVLSASISDNKISWFENVNGMGIFGSPQTISSNAIGAASVFATDIDGDGDMDVLSGSLNDNKVTWFKNTNGLGVFGSEQIVVSNAERVQSVYALDLDGDGDKDVMYAAEDNDRIVWCENTDGLGSFGSKNIISSNADGARSIFATDIDGDGDADVLSASRYDSKIAWYENLNGLGSFGAEQIITTNVLAALSVYAADIDNDGDMDVLSGSNTDSKIAWYENKDGQGTFGNQKVITVNADGVIAVNAADVDGDGDIDILSASARDHKIAWYENLTVIGINYNRLDTMISVYPIPTAGILRIDTRETFFHVNIYNNTSQMVLSSFNSKEIDISSLPSGLYTLRIEGENGIFATVKVQKGF